MLEATSGVSWLKHWVEMLERSDTSISDALKAFNACDMEVGFIVPTETGLKKSILDATASVRQYLHDFRYHDYGQQRSGPDAKIVKTAYLVYPDRIEEASVSMYRPETKNGDPRIWFSKLGGYAAPFNLLALHVHDGRLFVINCSQAGFAATLRDPSTPIGAIAQRASKRVDPNAAELLFMIQQISKRGFLTTLRPGDTGVGMTLETLLGISANANTSPDYKGIEIKAKRLRGKNPTRHTLFSQVPDWSLSPIGSAWNLLSAYGYQRSGKLRLNHQVTARAPNSLGFQLEVDPGNDWLKQNHYDAGNKSSRHVVTWQMPLLRQRLLEKHPQTFWVGARCRGRGASEEFHYTQVEHTGTPRVRNFEALLEGGLISVDYLMSQKDPARPVVRDHGYLFKIGPSDFEALFPRVDVHLFDA